MVQSGSPHPHQWKLYPSKLQLWKKQRPLCLVYTREIWHYCHCMQVKQSLFVLNNNILLWNYTLAGQKDMRERDQEENETCLGFICQAAVTSGCHTKLWLGSNAFFHWWKREEGSPLSIPKGFAGSCMKSACIKSLSDVSWSKEECDNQKIVRVPPYIKPTHILLKCTLWNW